MSDDYVNQLTLNFLISKTQLAKLNKKIEEDTKNSLQTDKQIFREDIVDLFHKLLNNNIPSDLLHDVKDSFDHFIDKSIYYIKVHNDNNQKNTQDAEVASLEVEEDDELEVASLEDASLEDDDELDADDEVASLEDDVELEEDDDEVAELDDAELEDKSLVTSLVTSLDDVSREIISVRKKTKKQNMKTNGVEDIQKLPLDWFQSVRQGYKMTQILPRIIQRMM
jgi:hypothetical protein